MSREITLFIDAQNAYRNARRAFAQDSDPGRIGNFRPQAVAELIAARYDDRVVRQVRIYTGRPDRALQPAAHAANVRQSNAWAEAGCRVFPRTLRYPRGWPDHGTEERPVEKGVDVWLAVDFVSMALRGEIDVGVVLSADTDLLPALEEVRSNAPDVTIEVAGWRTTRARQRLSTPGWNLWCHWLEATDFEAIRDNTDYNIPRD